MKDNVKVFILHNILAPYRLLLFEEIAKKVDLKVYFCRKTKAGRLWEVDIDKYSFKREVLKNFSIGPFVFNFTLPVHLLKNKSEVYLVGENGFETMFSILWILLASKFLRRPLIVWSGKFETEWTKQKIRSIKRYADLILNLYRKVLYRNACAFVAYSEKAKEYLIKRGASPENIFVGGQCMPEEFLQKVQVSNHDTEYKDKLVILTISYLSKTKGINYLIQAFKELKSKDGVLVIAGSGKEEENLRILAGNNDKIHFVGYVDGFEKFKWYSIAHIFVLPSLYDAWGLVVNEAMWFGLPVITTHAAGCSEMIKDNGFLIPSADKQALKEALKCLLKNELLRQKMRQRSRVYVKEYNIHSAVKPFNKAINQAVNLKRMDSATR